MSTDCMISNPKDIKEIFDKSFSQGIVALDTEFVWNSSYYPRLGVVQISLSSDESFLLDSPNIEDYKWMAELISSEEIVKVFHDPLQDLMLLKLVTGAFPKNIYDTRLGAGFSGNSATISLQNLVLSTFAIDMPKTESRTDWLKRPLTEKQIEYAIDDVKYLPDIYAIQKDMAEKQSTWEWLSEDLSIYNQPYLYEDAIPEKAYLKVKGHGTLSSFELALLREFAAKREIDARQRDLPKGWVCSDSQLLEIVSHYLGSEEIIRISKGKWNNEQDQKEISRLADKVKTNMEEFPQPFEPHPKEKEITRIIKKMREVIKAKSNDMFIDPQVVANRKDLRNFIIGQGSSKLNSGWRKQHIAIDLEEFIL